MRMANGNNISKEGTRRSLLQSLGVLGIGIASSTSVSGSKPDQREKASNLDDEIYTGYRLPGVSKLVNVAPDELQKMSNSESRFGSQTNTLRSGDSEQITVPGAITNSQLGQLSNEEEAYLNKCGIEPSGINLNYWYKPQSENSEFEISGITNGNSADLTIAHSQRTITLEVSSPKQSATNSTSLPSEIDSAGWFRVTVVERAGQVLVQIYQSDTLIDSAQVADNGRGRRGISGRLSLEVNAGTIESSPFSAGTLHDVLATRVQKKGNVQNHSIQNEDDNKSVVFEFENKDSYSLKIIESGHDRYIVDQNMNTFYTHYSPEMIESISKGMNIVFDGPGGDQ